MKVKINFLPEFLRLAKPLRKKYASFEEDFIRLLAELESNPFLGTPLGEGVRKVRLAIGSLAHSIGADRAYITRIENGQIEPRVSTFCRIAATLGCSVGLTFPMG